MKRWKLGLVGLTLAVSGLMGCKQQLFINEPDFDHYKSMTLKLGGPADLENDPSVSLIPGKYNVPPPPTVSDPDRPIRYLTLQEAIAIALEQGNIGSQNPTIPGVSLDQNNVTARAVFSDSIRVISLDPAIAGADIEASLAKFDARFISSMTWNKTDSAIANGLQSFNNGDQAALSTGLYKPLPTGGTVGITSSIDYSKLATSPNFGGFSTLNPSYKPRLLFQFEQPLLQSYGVEINQLDVNHPGTQTITGFTPPGGGRVEGVLITRLRYDQSKADFERQLNFMLVNVEYAYWNLYAAYGSLYARDQALIESVDLWKVIKSRFEQGIAKPHEEARARAQVEGFRAQRFTALGQVIEAERQVRALLGMPYDGTRLVPIDAPTLAAFKPDMQTAVDEAMNNRPELIIARQDLKFRQFDIMIQKNLLKPDLRFFANYDVNGIGTQLDGSPQKVVLAPNGFGGFNQTLVPQNALANFASNQFNSWQLGFRLNVPLGFHDAHSAVRAARLNLARSYASLKDSERKIEEQVRVYYARLDEYYQTVRAQKSQYKAAAEEYRFLEARKDLEQELPAILEAMLNAQQTKVAALAAEYRAIADYNNTLAGFQFSKGTILQYDTVNIADGPLPAAAAVRAVDHLRERTKALVLRERPGAEFAPAGTYPIDADPTAGVMPRFDDGPAQSVPDMMRSVPRPMPPADAQGNRQPVRSPIQPASLPPSMTGTNPR